MGKHFRALPAVAQAALLGVLPLLAAFAVYWYLVRPIGAKCAELEAKAKSLHQQNLRDKAFEQQRDQYLKRMSELRGELEAARAAVPDDDATDSLIDMVNQTGARSGVHVRSLVSQPVVGRDLYTEVPFKLRLDGTYYAMLDFFARLSQAPRLVSVTALQLGSPAHGGMGSYTVSPAETVGVNCIVTAYVGHPPPAPAGAKKAQH